MSKKNKKNKKNKRIIQHLSHIQNKTTEPISSSSIEVKPLNTVSQQSIQQTSNKINPYTPNTGKELLKVLFFCVFVAFVYSAIYYVVNYAQWIKF